MIKLLKNKKGMVFGLDARVTLAVTSILLLVVGFNQFKQMNRGNILQAESELKVIKMGLENYYQTLYQIPSVDTLVSEQYISLDENVNSDPWGNTYDVGFIEKSEIINGLLMSVKYIWIISKGKDGILNSSTPNDKTSWLAWESAGDDIAMKFSTHSVEENFAEIESRQLGIIKTLLAVYVNAKELENETFCNSTSNQLSKNCDINDDNKYEEDEELGLNYMPKEVAETNGQYYITINPTHNTENKFRSGYVDTVDNTEYNMYSFIKLIGGNRELVNSPRGLVLNFDSNIYKNTQAPYYAQIWYGPEKTIF